MKDLSLSLLSRGCGRFVSSGRYDGRLDVCFTPQDYYIWRSQVSFLQVSNRGHLHVEAEATLPKTYSTRRGPLLLYSQDLVTIETSCHSGTRDRKQRVVRRYTRQVERDLGTVKELTAAILSYSNNQFTSSRLGPPFFPPLHLPPVPDLHRPSPPPIRTTREQPSQELPVQLNPEWLPAEPNTEQEENQPGDEEEEQRKRKRVRLDVFLQIPCTSRAPSPQRERQPCAHSDSMISEEEPQTSLDMTQQQTDSSHQIEVNQQSVGGELHHPNMTCVPDMADDQSHSNQDSERTSDNGNYERSVNANRHGLLPPLTERHSVHHGPCWERTDRPRLQGPSSDEHYAQPLPPIAESCAVDPDWVIRAQTQKDARPNAETFGCQSQGNLNRLHQQLLFPPLLFPGKEEEMSGKERGGGEKTERQNFKKEAAVRGGGGGGGRLPSEKGSVILLEPGEEPLPPVGVSGCVAGWRGRVKQSSLAFLQNPLLYLQDPCEANRGVVRGILPLELRDLQNGKSVGSLILGPDGEIIQLSLYDSSHNPPQGACDTQEQALQVLSAEGEKLPWVIVLQPEHTHAACAERGVELHTGVPEGDIQHHQSKLVGLHSDTSAYTPSRHTDPVAVTQEKIKSAEVVTETRKAPKKDANSVRLPPLREPRGGHAEAEEEDKQEEQGGTQQPSHLSGSHQPSLSREKLQIKDEASCSEQNINSEEATTEDAVDHKRRNTKRRDAQDVKTGRSADAEGQKTSRTRKEGRRQRHKMESDAAPSTRSQKQEEKTNGEAAEAKKQSAVPPEKKKTTHRQEEMEVKENGEKEERGEVTRLKEESAGRRRRRGGRLKHKELVTDNHKKEELETNKEVEEGSRLKYTKRFSATQRHNNTTETNPEEDADRDHLSGSADRHSSVQSASSLRSTAAASQFSQRSRRRSAASSCEGAVPTSATGLALSRGRLSSCSTVMVTEDQLMLNTMKPESSRPRKREEEVEEEDEVEKAAALRLAQRAERRRLEVERKRREREEEERKQQEREQTEERMKSELEEERRKKAEELRLKRLAEEEERRKHEEEEQERARREHAQRERETRRQEERRRQVERFQRMREEEEQKRKAELELLRLEEQRRQEEESKKLQEMDESERTEYLRRKEQEEEDRRKKEEERRRTEEEAAFQAAEEDRQRAELLARQMALLQQQLAFKRGLTLEAEGLEKTQGISRPWIYSYFSLLELLGLSSATAGTTTP